jgi:regulator of protease activity HflC (stomatin/prohibitin superfamily)
MKMDSKLGYIGTLAVIAVVLAVILVPFSLITVDASETCAITTWGRLVGQASSGLHWRTPLVTHFRCYTQRGVVYEASANPDTSEADYTDFTVEAQTSDGQQIDVTYSVRFYIAPENVQSVYANVGENMHLIAERVVKFHSRSIVRLTMQEYAASTLYTGSITGVQSEIETELTTLFAASGVTLDSFVLRKIDFDPDFIQAIEAQQIARENIETANFQAQSAEFEADRIGVLARGEADAAIERARGEAQRQRLLADAEAYSITVRGEALKNNPALVQWEFVRNLATAKWMILPDTGITPLLPVPEP